MTLKTPYPRFEVGFMEVWRTVRGDFSISIEQASAIRRIDSIQSKAKFLYKHGKLRGSRGNESSAVMDGITMER